MIHAFEVFEEAVLEGTKPEFGNRIEIVERMHPAQMDCGKLAILVQCLGKIAPLNRESVYRRLATLPRLLAQLDGEVDERRNSNQYSRQLGNRCNHFPVH